MGGSPKSHSGSFRKAPERVKPNWSLRVSKYSCAPYRSMRLRRLSLRAPAATALLQAVVGCPATKRAGKLTLSALRTAVTAGQTASSLEFVRSEEHTSELQSLR